MGFLATVEAYELDKLARLVRGDYRIDERTLLQVNVYGANTFRQYALNDVVISKPGLNQTIEVSITCDGIPVNQFMGGRRSGCYAYRFYCVCAQRGRPRAGRPYRGYCNVPAVCTQHAQPAHGVFRSAQAVGVAGRGVAGALVSCDGWAPERIAFGDTVEVSLSERSVSLVSFSEADQFEAIDKKLKGR